MEVVIDVAAETWMAFGWKPADANLECMKYTETPESDANGENKPALRLVRAAESAVRGEADGATPGSPNKAKSKEHLMNCMDVVIGMVDGDLQRVTSIIIYACL